jgi:decaprenyl-phosphate phosphoribosyltransferase
VTFLQYNPLIKEDPAMLLSPNKITHYFGALRPRQWSKNLIVFAAPLFALRLEPTTILGSLLAFFCFSCTSSSFYIFNDILDLEADRKHPVKCNRPIASGLVSVKVALALAVFLLAGSLILAWLLSKGLALSIAAYAFLQVSYNLRLKHTVILDVITIATGFVFRACGGAAATNISLSPWFLLCTAMLALFLGVEKRKAELKRLDLTSVRTRYTLKRYSHSLLSRMENVVTTGTILTYALWSAGPKLQGASTPWMLLTVPFVLYGIFRYQLLSDPKEINRRKIELNQEAESQSERPEEILLRDSPIRLTVLSWIFTTFIILLLKKKGLIL